MEETKSLLLSKTFWGAVLALLSGILSILGYTLTSDEQQETLIALGGIGTTFGSLLAVYGRVKATKRIGE